MLYITAGTVELPPASVRLNSSKLTILSQSTNAVVEVSPLGAPRTTKPSTKATLSTGETGEFEAKSLGSGLNPGG